MDDKPDSELIGAYRRTGDTGCLDVLVRRHLPKVRSMIYSIVLNNADADELTQDVFLSAIRGLPAFEGRSSFKTWLCRIALNATRNFLKRKGRNPVEHRADPPDQSDPGTGRAHDRLMLAETDAGITRALGELSPRLRAALSLTILQGHSIREAADLECCLTATMYWRVHQARKEMRAALEKEGMS